ncbi:MAG: outer membrane beta-barrel protein [Burkholderiales bacterium]
MLAAIALMPAAIPAAALAQDARWFAGVGIGYLKTDDACPATAAPGGTCEDKDTTWKIFGGYQFSSYFGYEVGLADLGERPASFSGLGAASARFRIFELLLVGTLPVSREFAVYAKAGAFGWDADYTFAPGVAASADANGTDFTFGIGVTYRLTRNAALRLEWQRYRDIGDPATTGTFDADVFGVGALIRF